MQTGAPKVVNYDKNNFLSLNLVNYCSINSVQGKQGLCTVLFNHSSV